MTASLRLKALCANKELRLVLGLALVNALAWTFFAVCGGNPNLHGDSLEAYVWGREFQLGYYKHPPFWAWVAGIWFSVFPHTDWAFYLLSELNAALGLAGAWALIGRFTKSPQRLAATVLLLLTSFFTYNALRFNANTVQISLWPWTMYALLVSLDTKTIKSGVALGLLSAAAFLSKYYAVFLLATCFFAILAHKEGRAYLRSRAAWAAIGVFTLAVGPHVYWLIAHDFQPFAYAAQQTSHPKPKFVSTKIGFLVSCLMFHALQLAAIGLTLLTQKGKTTIVALPMARHDKKLLAILGLAPLAMTIAIGWIGYRATPNYIIPICALIPLILLVATKADPTRVTRVALTLFSLVTLSIVLFAPFALSVPSNEELQPRSHVYPAALAEWQKVTDAPLRLVSGSRPYSEALTYYAKGDVSEFTEMNPDFAPWVSPQRVKEQGLLVLCLPEEGWCLDAAEALKTPETRISQMAITPTQGRYTGPTVNFVIYAIPPEKSGT